MDPIDNREIVNMLSAMLRSERKKYLSKLPSYIVHETTNATEEGISNKVPGTLIAIRFTGRHLKGKVNKFENEVST